MSMVTLAPHSMPANQSASIQQSAAHTLKTSSDSQIELGVVIVANEMRSCETIKVALCSHRGHCDHVTGSIRMRPLLTRIGCTPAVDLSALQVLNAAARKPCAQQQQPQRWL